MGYSFKRQRPVLNYIADFMCKELMLIIEADGWAHTWEEVARKDVIRNARLKKAGFETLRFTDEQILNDMEAVIRTIEEYIRDFEQRKSGVRGA